MFLGISVWEGQSYSPGKNSRVVKDSTQSAVMKLGDTGLQLVALSLQSLFVPTVPLAQETHKSRDPGLSGRYSHMAAYATASQSSVPYKAHQVGQGNGRKNISKLHKTEASTATYPKGFRLPERVTKKRTAESPTHLSGSLKSTVPLHSSLPSGANDS